MCNKYIVNWSGQECSSHINPYLCALFYWSDKMKEEYFKILLKLAKKAAKKGEVPISALIVKNNKIIAKNYNKRQKQKDIFNHAEMLVIKKTSRKLNRWHLNDCDLYVTLKPCKMCEAAINQSRIRNVYYLLDKPENKKEYNKTNYAETNISMLKEAYSQELSGFFQKQRDKKKYI